MAKILTEVKDSSNIRKIHYNDVTESMEVMFKGGTIYKYEAVPAKIHKYFIEAASKGKFFSQYIKNSYTGRKIK